MNCIAQLGGWEFDCATRQVVFSSELADLLGGSPAPMDYADALNFWVDEDRAAFADHLEQASTFGREFTFEGRFRGPDGSIRWMRVLGEPELVDGWCVALRGASQDITEWRSSMDRLREFEQTALKASEAMSNFLTNMSHELRTPLNGVLGMAEVMAWAPLSDVQRQRLGVIQMSGEALLAQLNDLLDLSKITAGGMQLANDPIHLQDLADGVQIFTALAQDKGTDLDRRPGAENADRLERRSGSIETGAA